VHAKNVTVEGRLNGDVSADDRVELVASATVDGNIKAPKIVVAEGAKFRGSVDMGKPKDAGHEQAAKK
jgi:cytoskeletal protein CcmA (bactofilin family)